MDGRNIYDIFHNVGKKVANTTVQTKIAIAGDLRDIICEQMCEMNSTLYKNLILKKCPEVERSQCLALDKMDFTVKPNQSTK
jgi:hypothetical protein